MDFTIRADFDHESGLKPILTDLYRAGYEEFFLGKSYGADLLRACVVLMCRDPALHFKQRIRLVKKEKQLYMDLMLDLNEMKAATSENRRRIIVERLAKEVPETLSKYRLKDFDEGRFANDLRTWLDGLGWN